MPPAGEAAIVRDGVACVDVGGVAVTDPECVCGAPSCTGCPCCNGGRLCAPPGIVPGGVNVQSVSGEAVRDIALNSGFTQHREAAIDQLADIGCGEFTAHGPRGSPPFEDSLTITRGLGSFNFPSSPGFKPWHFMRAVLNGPGSSGVAYWRPDATWWVVGEVNQGNPTSTNGTRTATGSATIGQCAKSMSISYSAVDTSPLGGQESFSASASVGGTLLPCSGQTDAPCEDCLDGFAPRAQGPGA